MNDTVKKIFSVLLGYFLIVIFLKSCDKYHVITLDYNPLNN